MSGPTKAKFEAAFKRSKEAAGVKTEGEQDPAVQELWALIEPRLEERGLFEREVREHLHEATEDVKSWRFARNLTLWFAIAVIIIVALSLGWVLFCPESTFQLANLGGDSVRIAFLTGCFAIIFGLTAIIVRGAFAAARKDDASAVLPENTKLMVDTLASLMGSKN